MHVHAIQMEFNGNQMHYAENECAMPIRLPCNELRALCLTTNAICRTAEIDALHLFAVNLGASAHCLEICSALNFDNAAQCTVIWNYGSLFGVEAPTFGIVHSILTDQVFNLDDSALVGKVHKISVKQKKKTKKKTISADSIQFRKCVIGFCKRFPSPQLPSLGRLLSRLPCDSPWVFPDRPNFNVNRTCDSVSNQRRFPNSGGQ